MSYICKTKISQAELREALLLDKQCFGDRSAVYKVCKFWLIKNDESFIILKEKSTNKVVGYICFLPLAEKIYKKYLSGEIHEYQLRSKDIMKYDKGKSYDCLFCSIIIDEKHRDGTAIKVMMNGYNDLMKSLQKRGICIKKIVADCITDDGIKFIRRENYNFVKAYDGGKIFEKIIAR